MLTNRPESGLSELKLIDLKLEFTMKIYVSECVFKTTSSKPVRYGYLSGIAELQFCVLLVKFP